MLREIEVMVVSQGVHGKHFMGDVSEVSVVPMYRHDPRSTFLRICNPLEELGRVGARGDNKQRLMPSELAELTYCDGEMRRRSLRHFPPHQSRNQIRAVVPLGLLSQMCDEVPWLELGCAHHQETI
jgi:hypothetical protein